MSQRSLTRLVVIIAIVLVITFGILWFTYLNGFRERSGNSEENYVGQVVCLLDETTLCIYALKTNTGQVYPLYSMQGPGPLTESDIGTKVRVKGVVEDGTVLRYTTIKKVNSIINVN